MCFKKNSKFKFLVIIMLIGYAKLNLPASQSYTQELSRSSTTHIYPVILHLATALSDR